MSQLAEVLAAGTEAQAAETEGSQFVAALAAYPPANDWQCFHKLTIVGAWVGVLVVPELQIAKPSQFLAVKHLQVVDAELVEPQLGGSPAASLHSEEPPAMLQALAGPEADSKPEQVLYEADFLKM